MDILSEHFHGTREKMVRALSTAESEMELMTIQHRGLIEGRQTMAKTVNACIEQQWQIAARMEEHKKDIFNNRALMTSQSQHMEEIHKGIWTHTSQNTFEHQKASGRGTSLDRRQQETKATRVRGFQEVLQAADQSRGIGYHHQHLPGQGRWKDSS